DERAVRRHESGEGVTRAHGADGGGGRTDHAGEFVLARGGDARGGLAALSAGPVAPGQRPGGRLAGGSRGRIIGEGRADYGGDRARGGQRAHGGCELKKVAARQVHSGFSSAGEAMYCMSVTRSP